MIRILQVLGGLDRGGAESMVMNIYRNVDRNQIQFDFIVHHPEKNAYFDEINDLGGRVFTFTNFNVINLTTYKSQWHRFFKEHPEYKILHSHLRSFASIYVPIAKSYGLTTIVHSHSTSNGTGVKSLVKDLLQRPLRKQANYLFACSEKAGVWLYGRNCLTKKNFFLVRNAIDIEQYVYNEIIRNKVRRDLNIEKNKVFGHVGRFTDAKNHRFLLEIFKEVSNTDKDAKLILVGDGPLKKEVEKQVEHLSLADKVIFLGQREDIGNILQAFDVFIFPSKWEGLPVSVIEAQASGLPCVISNNITQEINLTKAVHYFNLDDSPSLWAKRCMDLCGTRYNDDVEKLIEAKYDIKESVNWLTEFYFKILISEGSAKS